MNLEKRTTIVELISAFFILLFVYAALSKVLDFEKFRVELGKSPLLNSSSFEISIMIPIIEILFSVFLVIKRLQLIGLYAAFALMVMFSCYILAILKFSSYIPCSCGGILQNMSWNQHLIFNLVFIGLAIIAVLIYPKKNKDLIAQ